MEDVEIMPKNAPHITNMKIEALAWHNHQQKEARDCQEYWQQQDSTASPRAAFLPPKTVGRDITTELDSALLEGVEGTTAPVPEKKKITLDEYNRWEVLMLVDSEVVAQVSGAAETVDYFG